MGKIDVIRGIFYIAFQLAGATLGAVFVREMAPEHLKMTQYLIVDTLRNQIIENVLSDSSNSSTLSRVARQLASPQVRPKTTTTTTTRARITTRTTTTTTSTTTIASTFSPMDFVDNPDYKNFSISPVQLGLTVLNPKLTEAQGYFIEMIVTFILMMTVFACVDSKRKDLSGSFPLTIGLAVTVGALFAVSIKTEASSQ